MKKWTLLLLNAVLLIGILCGCGTVIEATPAEKFTYEMVDGEVTITGFIGTEREIVIPDTIEGRPVTKIAASAFKGYDMTYIGLPETLEEIGEFAFEECNCLESITFPNGLKRVEQGAFYECKALNDVQINEALSYLGLRVFGECNALKEIVLPENFTGFGTEYKVKYVSEPGVGVYAAAEGEAILDPIGSENTVLVVIEGSLAHRTLEAGNWFYDIHYEVRNQ